VAAVEGISPNTAASRYRYGIDKLRARLRPLYEEIR
jgi:RNA polymerase sigma-70 factor (ECF subfamily)